MFSFGFAVTSEPFLHSLSCVCTADRFSAMWQFAFLLTELHLSVFQTIVSIREHDSEFSSCLQICRICSDSLRAFAMSSVPHQASILLQTREGRCLPQCSNALGSWSQQRGCGLLFCSFRSPSQQTAITMLKTFTVLGHNTGKGPQQQQVLVQHGKALITGDESCHVWEHIWSHILLWKTIFLHQTSGFNWAVKRRAFCCQHLE